MNILTITEVANKYNLSNADDNNSGPLNRRSITDLHLLRTLLAIYQKLREPSFCVVKLLFYRHKQVWQLQEASWKRTIGLVQGIFTGKQGLF